jgi:hypothetical protein
MTPSARRWIVVALIVVTASAFGLETVGASVRQDSVVSEDPIDVTPNVESDDVFPNAAVYALGRIGTTMYAGGQFRTVTNASATKTYTRYNLMAFDAVTGAVKRFAPTFNGTVWAVRPKGSALYVGGDFTRVNGVFRRGLVKIDAKTGAVRRSFRPRIKDGNVTEIRLVAGRLIVGGSFPKRLAALKPHSGTDTRYIQAHITGRVGDNSGPTKVYRFAVNPADSRLVAIGNFTSVGGVSRRQAFMLRLGPRKTAVSNWYYEPLNNSCVSTHTPVYLRDVDFSPGGAYFVLVATGSIPTAGGVGRDICDAAARFETDDLSPDRPTWINYTGGDTLHSVAATGAAVYVQGHQRWLDNPDGNNYPGPGAVSREGIGAINPSTGLALDWNPGKTREVGGKDLLATANGLWVGSDGEHFAGEYRACIAFVPLT